MVLNTYFRHSILLIAFLSVGVFGQTDNDDVQFWSETTVNFPVDKKNEKLKGFFTGEFRIKENVSNLNDVRLQTGLKYQLTKSIKIQPSYLYKINKNSTDEHRLLFDATPKKDFAKLAVDNRNRFEHRFRLGGKEDLTFYRNRTRLRLSVSKGGEKLFTPYASIEPFVDIQKGELFRLDAIGGIGKRFTKNVSADAFYRYRTNYQSPNRVEKVIGLRVTTNFNLD